MNNGHQETSPDSQETEFGGPAVSKERRIIYFSSGETLEEEEEEEEEQSDNPPFREPAEKTRLSFKNVALLVARISLLTCDFLGERLAGALGLNAAKYQYAIDQYHRDHKVDEIYFAADSVCSILLSFYTGTPLCFSKLTACLLPSTKKSSQATDNHKEGQAETVHLSPGADGSYYGATGDDVRHTVDLHESCDEKHMDRSAGCHNRGYQADGDHVE